MTLQQQWDIWLAASFAKFPTKSINLAIYHFEEKIGMEHGSLLKSGIRHIPKEKGQGKFSSVSRFVCGFIPGAADFMFDTDKNTIQKSSLLAKCSDSTVDPFDDIKSRRESYEKARSKRKSRIAQEEYHLGNLQREAYGRRNWGACK